MSSKSTAKPIKPPSRHVRHKREDLWFYPAEAKIDYSNNPTAGRLFARPLHRGQSCDGAWLAQGPSGAYLGLVEDTGNEGPDRWIFSKTKGIVVEGLGREIEMSCRTAPTFDALLGKI